MGRPKGGQNKSWTQEEKYKLVLEVTEGLRSTHNVANEHNISQSMLSKWVRKYLSEGISGLENKKRLGNPLMKYSRKKNLTKEEKLEYENMKLRIENELLKKGYLMKGDGTIVKFMK